MNAITQTERNYLEDV